MKTSLRTFLTANCTSVTPLPTSFIGEDLLMRNFCLPISLTKFLFFSLSFFFSLVTFVDVSGQTQQTYTPTTSPKNFIVPSGVTQITVECWGGGGKGGDIGGGNATGSGGGGGGGAYSRSIISVTAGTTYIIGIGVGSINSSPGADSWFSLTNFESAVVVAKGGVSSTNSTGSSGGLASQGFGNVKYDGGAGASGSGITYSGGGGGSGEVSTNGNPGSTYFGGSTTSGGAGGNGKNATGSGSQGNVPGGGGGGALKTANGNAVVGGSGGDGLVKISYYKLTSVGTLANTCQSTSSLITLNSSSLNPGNYTVTYNLSTPNAATGNTASMTVSSAGSGTFSVPALSLSNNGTTTITITNIASGIYSSSVGTANTANIIVTSPSTPIVSAGSAITFCSGGNVTLTANSTGATTYQWYNDGAPILNANNQTYSANASGVYTVIAFIGSCSSATSSGTTITVNSLPSTPAITPSGPTTFCADGSVTLTSSTASTYQWYKNAVLIPGATNRPYSPTTSGTYTVVVTNAAGCTSAPSSGISVTVNPLPPIPTITGGPTTFCSGLNVVLTSSASSGNQWYNGSGLISGATSTTYTASASSGYLVRVTDANVCTSVSSVINVTVNPLPDITISSQATSLCSSAAIQTTQLIYTNPINTPTFYSITWSASPANSFVAVTDAALTTSPISISVPANVLANTYSGTLTVKNANGCQSSSKSFTVTVASSPNISNFSISAANGCAGTGAIVTVNSTSLVAGVYNVKYDLTGATVSSNNLATMTVSGNTGTFTALASNVGATTVTITEVSLVGCATAVSSNNTANFTINALPAVPSISGPNKVCVGATITLNSSPTGGTWSSSQPQMLQML